MSCRWVSLQEISHFHMMGNYIVFFSYHWPSWNRQGPDNIQRRAMDHALKLYGEKVGATFENMYVWLEPWGIGRLSDQQ